MINIGQLNRRVKIFEWQDLPEGDFGIAQDFTLRLEVWGNLRAIVGAAYRDGAQTFDEVTHRVVIRHQVGKTDVHQMSRVTTIEIDGQRYRIKRVNDWQDKRRFTVLEVLELGQGGS